MKKILLALFVFCSFGVIADENQASEASVRILLEKTHAGDMGKQIVDLMIPSLEKMLPDASTNFWADIKSKLDTKELVEKLIPVYMKNFTQAEVDASIKFYSSPEGQNILKKQATIASESFEIGKVYGQALAKEIIETYQNLPK